MFPEWKTFIDHSYPYLTANGFAVQCEYIWNYDGFKINPNFKFKNWAYVKTDFIHQFFKTVKIKEPLVLLTGNSDIPIDDSFLKYLNRSDIIIWFGQNIKINHHKLKAIPIGIANAGYPFGDIKILNKIQKQNNQKQKLFYCNFTVDTNKQERQYCLEQTNLSLVEHKDGGWDGVYNIHGIDRKVPNTFEGYLSDLSESFFSICPNGNGIDSHRVWESLYLKTIPIITKNLLAKEHTDIPMIVLDDWSNFKKIKFDKILYTKTWNDFDVNDLTMPKYIQRIHEKIAHQYNDHKKLL